MKTHELKTWTEYFERVLQGHKPFEVRKNDRDFQAGDKVLLREWDWKQDLYTGRELSFTISYVLNGGQFGVKKGYCVFGLII